MYGCPLLLRLRPGSCYTVSKVIWLDKRSERLLRRWLALQIICSISGALLAAYLLWGRDEDGTAERADDYVRSGRAECRS